MMELSSRLSLADEPVLLHELTHRINNEFAAAIGTVSLAAARSGNDEVKAALSEVADLLHQHAEVHRALQRPEYDIMLDADSYLQQLCLSISRSYLDHRKIRLVLATEPVWLAADRCWRLGMIVYELIINSARHAFSGDEGEIRVELRRVGAIAQCSVVDNGSVAATAALGRGLKIIGELSKSLGGRFVQKFGSRGSRSTLAFPSDCEPEVIAGKPRTGVQTPEPTAQALDDSPSTEPAGTENGGMDCAPRRRLKIRTKARAGRSITNETLIASTIIDRDGYEHQSELRRRSITISN
jgi:two-component sensor histidine kinase